MSKTVFITGATGNIGGKILLTLVKNDPDAKIIAPVRSKSPALARQRLAQTLSFLDPEFDVNLIDQRVQLVCGDITDQTAWASG